MLASTACRESEPLDLRPPKAPGVPIFAGDQLGSDRLLRMRRPEYPAALRYLGRQTVRLKFTLLEDGRVADASYISGPGVLLTIRSRLDCPVALRARKAVQPLYRLKRSGPNHYGS